mmetsp:Transcript_29147/g.58208  ORF Transcript_29147/g.58208 Transcript_29147/m.58208 type:complete len:364 (-) Transcript_29147:1229-2320(-)
MSRSVPGLPPFGTTLKNQRLVLLLSLHLYTHMVSVLPSITTSFVHFPTPSNMPLLPYLPLQASTPAPPTMMTPRSSSSESAKASPPPTATSSSSAAPPSMPPALPWFAASPLSHLLIHCHAAGLPSIHVITASIFLICLTRPRYESTASWSVMPHLLGFAANSLATTNSPMPRPRTSLSLWQMASILASRLSSGIATSASKMLPQSATVSLTFHIPVAFTSSLRTSLMKSVVSLPDQKAATQLVLSPASTPYTTRQNSKELAMAYPISPTSATLGPLSQKSLAAASAGSTVSSTLPCSSVMTSTNSLLVRSLLYPKTLRSSLTLASCTLAVSLWYFKKPSSVRAFSPPLRVSDGYLLRMPLMV